MWNDEPRKGRLPVAEVRLLADALKPFTATAETCWFALWEGFNAVEVPAHVERLAMPVLDTQRVTWDSDIINPLPAPPT
ncbi:hypothetical protein [Rhodococcus sp. NPDC058514]|uniref:hypothetical protein n=1 Tax=unclassified Rhodococcus (in: high G+C Gram-positive bacteria) TaxID=192944 RepID=UPI003655F949